MTVKSLNTSRSPKWDLTLHDSQTRVVHCGIGSEMFAVQYFMPLISANSGTCLGEA